MENRYFKTQIYLNPILMKFFFTSQVIVFFYNCKETHQIRNTEDLKKRSYF